MNWPESEIGKHVDNVETWNPAVSPDEEPFQYIDLSSIDKDRKLIVTESVQRILPADAPSRARQLVKDGDVLVSSVRPNLNGVALVAGNFDGATASTGYCVLRPNNISLDRDYLFYWVQSGFFVADMVQKATGASYPAVTDKIIKESSIPLPPLKTQKQIVAILEKADQLRKDCQQMEQELNSLAQSVFMDMFGDPVTNPKGFKTKSLDMVAEVQIGPFGTQLHKEDYVSDGIPLINPTHIKNGKIVPDQDLTITQDKYDELTQYHMKEGDIVMGRRGEMGRTAVIDAGSSGWFCGTGSLYIRPNKKQVVSEYLNAVLSSVSMKEWLEEQSLGATMANLNKKILYSIRVPIPDLSLQQKYKSALIAIESLRKSAQDDYYNLDSLFAALMQKAFKGELRLPVQGNPAMAYTNPKPAVRSQAT